MALEIERKFLVTSHGYRSAVSHDIRQGYLCLDPDRTVRVRLVDAQGFITIKGPGLITRQEFEYAIPLAEAEALLRDLCIHPIITKTRHKMEVDGFVFEVDEFHGANDGLIVAEIELDNEHQEFPRPSWLGQEVTQDPRYTNARLVQRPYRDW